MTVLCADADWPLGAAGPLGLFRPGTGLFVAGEERESGTFSEIDGGPCRCARGLDGPIAEWV